MDEFSDRVLFAQTDVTSEADVRSAIAAGEERFGPLRGVVACAGVLHAERVLGRDGMASFEAFRRVIDINLNGTFNTVRLAAEAIARSEPQEDGLRGVFVMTSSVSAFEGQIGQAAYCRIERRRRVAHVAAGSRIRPARHPRRLDRPRRLRYADDAGRAGQGAAIAQSSRFRFHTDSGKPEEFASLVCHIFENNMLNGCVLRLDGALRMGPK